MENKLVTIITVSYNSEKTIRKTIEAVLNQSYSKIEYIIVDGLSTDQTVKIAKEYEEAFSKKGYAYQIVSEKDEGMYDALNKGINLASGFLVGNTNADDWYEKDAISKMVALYEKEHYDLAWSDIRIIKSNGENTKDIKNKDIKNKDIIKKAKVGRFAFTSGFCHPTMFATKEILKKFPYENRAMDDDFDMYLRARKSGAKISTLNEVLANYSFGGMSTEKKWSNTVFRIRMKYVTYRKNGYSPLYWFYCVAMEMAKFILG